jgi:hypothetical protein
MLRIPCCADNWLIDGCMVVSPTHQPRSIPQKRYIFLFLALISVRVLSEPQGLVRPEGLKVARSRPDEVNEFLFSIYLILPATGSTFSRRASICLVMFVTQRKPKDSTAPSHMH